MALFSAFLSAAPSAADVFHVRVGGSLATGASLPSDWSLPNCYPTLALALTQAGAADSVLCYKEPHTVAGAVVLTAYLANQDHDGASEDCILQMAAGAQLAVNDAVAQTTIRGLTFLGEVGGTDLPALVVDNTAGLITAVTILDCAFQDLHTTSVPDGGSCLQAASPGNGLVLTVQDCRFRDNVSDRNGGAVFVGDGYQIEISGSEFTRNDCQVANGGGALAVVSNQEPSSLAMTSCLVDSNRSLGGPGGGILVENAVVSLVDCDVVGNLSAANGLAEWGAGAGMFVRRDGAIDPQDTLLMTITDSRIIGNQGNPPVGPYAADGGGVLVKGYDPTRLYDLQVTDTLFAENYNSSGAGLYVGRYVVATVRRCTFLRNTAYLNGGGSYKGGGPEDCAGETAVYEYCLFQENQAGYDLEGATSPMRGWGGAFMSRRYPRAELLNCTFVDNISGGFGHRGDSFYHHDDGWPFDSDLQRCVLKNCLFYGENGLDIQVRADSTGFSEVANCAWETGQFACLGVTDQGTVLLPGFPFLSAEDFHLNGESGCIDAGLDLGFDTDITGAAVPQGEGPDIGAFETVDPESVSDPPPDAEVDQIPGPADIVLLSCYPNPFNPRTTVLFTLDRPADVRLRVFDLAGSLVKELAAGPHAAGPHQAAWDGTDAGGRLVGAGVYLVRLETASRVRCAKLILLK